MEGLQNNPWIMTLGVFCTKRYFFFIHLSTFKVEVHEDYYKLAFFHGETFAIDVGIEQGPLKGHQICENVTSTLHNSVMRVGEYHSEAD